MKKLGSLIVALLLALPLFAQKDFGSITGTLVSRSGRQPIAGATVSLRQEGAEIASCKSAADGKFLLEGVENGRYQLVFSADGFIGTTANITVEGFEKDLVFVTMSAEQLSAQEVDDSNFAEFDLEDSGYSDAPSIIFGNNDVFTDLVSFGFSAIRFKNRGYGSETQDVYFSGVHLNDALTGFSPFSLWSGLNEATRSKESTLGLEASPYGVGGYNGVTNILGTPKSVRQGLRASVLTNSAMYRLRLMLNYASAENDKGWSFAANASVRLGGNDWIKGVYYRSLAYYIGVEKNWNDIHRLSLVTFGAPGQRGAQNASTQEVYDLMGDNMYNSNWGYQNGKVRNARVRKTFEPVTSLKYTYTPTRDFESVTTLLWRTGKNGYTALDWYDAPDPRPDYYRNLPSYAYMADEDYNRSNENKAEWMTEAWNPKVSDYVRYQHIDWDHLYNVNYSVADGRAKYVQEERRVDQNDFNFAETVKWRISDKFLLNAGATLRYNRTENYKVLADLLGGKYYVNIDSFAERDYASDERKIQNDLDYYESHGQAQILKEGDKYGYDYFANVVKAGAWANGNFTYGGLSLNGAASVGYDSFWREGVYRKGLFPDDSKGKSAVSKFITYSGKLNVAYTIPSGHRFSANVGYFNDAPTFSQAFISPRTRNTLIDGLTTVKTFSSDVNYQLNKAGYSLRLTGFYTTIKDQSDVMSFYDDSQHSFTNFAMTGIDQRHMGVEFGAEVPLPLPGLTAAAAVSWGEYIYTSAPHMVQTIDNSSEIIRDETVPYWASHPVLQNDGTYNKQKHYVPSTPQFASELALNYNVNYWYFELNGQYFANSYLDMNPLYRTYAAVYGPDGICTQEEINDMCSQEKFKPAFLMNLSVGKSWYKNGRQIGFSLQANNLLNRKDVRTGGYEQTRLITSGDKSRYYRFDSKYFYMSGINYMLNIYFRF